MVQDRMKQQGGFILIMCVGMLAILSAMATGLFMVVHSRYRASQSAGARHLAEEAALSGQYHALRSIEFTTPKPTPDTLYSIASFGPLGGKSSCSRYLQIGSSGEYHPTPYDGSYTNCVDALQNDTAAPGDHNGVASSWFWDNSPSINGFQHAPWGSWDTTVDDDGWAKKTAVIVSEGNPVIVGYFDQDLSLVDYDEVTQPPEDMPPYKVWYAIDAIHWGFWHGHSYHAGFNVSFRVKGVVEKSGFAVATVWRYLMAGTMHFMGADMRGEGLAAPSPIRPIWSWHPRYNKIVAFPFGGRRSDHVLGYPGTHWLMRKLFYGRIVEGQKFDESNGVFKEEENPLYLGTYGPDPTPATGTWSSAVDILPVYGLRAYYDYPYGQPGAPFWSGVSEDLNTGWPTAYRDRIPWYYNPHRYDPDYMGDILDRGDRNYFNLRQIGLLGATWKDARTAPDFVGDFSSLARTTTTTDFSSSHYSP